MRFRKFDKSPISMAFLKASEAIILVKSYQHNAKYIPSKREMKLFHDFAETMYTHAHTARKIASYLEWRASGEERREIPDPNVIE